jgi:hypothetical protein
MTTNDMIDGVINGAQDLPRYAQECTNWAAGNAWWIALLVLVGLVLAHTVNRGLSKKPLAGRVALEVLPTTGFDPKPEEVVRFAHQLARAQRSVSRWLFTPSRGTAVRVRLMSTGGPLTMRVEGPARAASVLRHQGYAQCEIRVVDEDVTEHERPQIQLGNA